MSGIRKYIRHRRTPQARKPRRRKVTLNDVLLIAGLALTLAGGLCGLRDWETYQVGRHEHVAETCWGSVHVNAKEPGDVGVRASALAGFALAGIGLMLCMIAVVAFVLEKVVGGAPRVERSLRDG